MATLLPAAGSHVGDLRYLCVSQNLGAVDPSQSDISPEDIPILLRRFVVSMGAFIRALAMDMHHRASVRESNISLESTNRGASCSVDEFDIVVLHFQEIGGKKRNERVMSLLGEMVRDICPTSGWCSGLLMSTKECHDTFTAMGSVVFVSKRIVSITSILSYKRNRTFVALDDDPISYVGGDIDEKDEGSKDLLFVGRKFSEAGSSRKGYMLMSLRVGTQVLNFVNVHMFHDEDNREAVKESPSPYAIRRMKAWRELICDILPLLNTRDPCFIFGDLNTRLDGVELYDFAQKQFDLAPILSKKLVERNEAFWSYITKEKNVSNLLKFDKELSTLLNIAGQHGMELGEFPVVFPPTFTKAPAPEHERMADSCYSQMNHSTGLYDLNRIERPNKNERLPGFCDRIIFNPEGLKLVNGQYSTSSCFTKPNVWKLYQYNSTVIDATDHDCVYLAF